MINQIENASLIYEILVYLNSFYFGKCRHCTQIIVNNNNNNHTHWKQMELINEFISSFYWKKKGCWLLSNMAYSFSKRVSWWCHNIITSFIGLGIKYWNIFFLFLNLVFYFTVKLGVYYERHHTLRGKSRTLIIEFGLFNPNWCFITFADGGVLLLTTILETLRIYLGRKSKLFIQCWSILNVIIISISFDWLFA